MSCPPPCKNTSKGSSGSGAPPPSHRTVQVAVERSPTRGCYAPTNLDAFGSNFGEYAAYARGPPYAGRQSTPGPGGIPAQHETFGSQIADYNLSWMMPRGDVNISDLLDQPGNARPRRFDRNAPPPQTPPPPDPYNNPGPSRPLLEQGWQDEAGALPPPGGWQDEAAALPPRSDKPHESLMQWFDTSVEKELKKHKDTMASGGPVDVHKKLADLNISKNVMDRLAEASASNVEFVCQMRREPDTELNDAVDKLAKAQAMCAFAGAVKAAEAAAEKAPPGRAEEAALTSAKEFQTEVTTTNKIQETLGGGTRPIEVVGYIGVTKPKHPIRRTNK